MADPVIRLPAGGPGRIDLGSVVLASIYAGSIAGGTTVARALRVAPIVGALLGAAFPIAVLVTLANENTSSTSETVIALLPFAVCGALGGGIGGIALHPSTAVC